LVASTSKTSGVPESSSSKRRGSTAATLRVGRSDAAVPKSAGGPWHVYLALCADGSLYCGIARDVSARIAEHDAGKGARYTRGRGPLAVLATQRCRSQGLALRIEHAVKRLTRAEKLELANTPVGLRRLARRVRRAVAASRSPAKRERR
jgi:putative endonuclease